MVDHYRTSYALRAKPPGRLDLSCQCELLLWDARTTEPLPFVLSIIGLCAAEVRPGALRAAMGRAADDIVASPFGLRDVLPWNKWSRRPGR